MIETSDWRQQFAHKITAAKQGDALALDFLKRFGPNGRLERRLIDLERELQEVRDELDRLPTLCEEHVMEVQEVRDASIVTCVMCGKREVV